MPMSFDPQHYDAGRGVRQPSILCGDAAPDHDSHGHGHHCCDVAIFPRNITAREHWSNGTNAQRRQRCHGAAVEDSTVARPTPDLPTIGQDPTRDQRRIREDQAGLDPRAIPRGQPSVQMDIGKSRSSDGMTIIGRRRRASRTSITS
jgi:hypothetical protein